MRELLVIVIPSLLLAALAEFNSVTTTGMFGEKKYIQKDKIFFTIMAVAMAVFVGLRTDYNDTTAYTHAYELLPESSSSLGEIDWSIGENPGFAFVNVCLRILGVSTQNFLMLYAMLTVCIYVWFVRKYSDNLWLSMFFFFAMGCYTFTMAAIKQTVAVALCLVATDRAIEKKWLSFVVWILVATTFHPYALMYLIAPLLMFNPWTTNTYFMIVIFGVAGVGLQSLLGTIVDVTSMLGEEYTATSFSGDGVSIFRVAVVWVPIFLSFLARKFIKENDERAWNLIINFTMLNAEIMFIALFGTANYFARLANYFLIFQAIALPKMFKFYTKAGEKVLTISAIIGYLLYFYYAEGILYGGFDAGFNGISFAEYVHSFIIGGQ